jgi:gamma-glutamyltranspeptidase/glutathione hydrolase
VDRLGGPDRYATAALVAQELGRRREVVLASGSDEHLADILAAGSLAAATDPAPLPVLLTTRDELPLVTAQALAEAGASRVFIVGGEQAVSAQVERRVRASGIAVERLGGADRYETAALVAGEALRRMTAPTLPLVVTSGKSFAGALPAAALAARLGALLVPVPPDGPASGAPAGSAKIDRLLTLAGPRLDEAWVVGGSPSAAGVEQIRAAIAAGPLSPTAVAIGGPGAGAVTSVEPLATRAGLKVLEGGGNAVDAAVAVAGVLGVAEPFSGGIGGGGFMVVYSAADGTVTTFDSRETAPAAFSPEVFLDPASHEPIPFEERVTSGLGVGVPGMVAGWAMALDRFGTRSLSELLQPGIEAADYGFPLDETFVSQVEENAERFGAFPSTADLYLPLDGKPQATGAWFRNPDLARTMELIARDGSRAMTAGPVVQAVVATVRAPPVAPGAGLRVRPGLLTVADLAAYHAIERPPIVSDYRGFTIYGMSPPSSGGLTIALALNQLERFDLAGVPREEALHRYLESTRLAWADRNAFMADPAFVDVPVEGLLSQDYADARSALITDTAAAEPRGPGDPFAFQGSRRPRVTPTPGQARIGSTTHLTVADAQGNVVAYTFTIEQIGGSGIVVPGYGFLLNNELTDFDPEPAHPNAPASGKRPLSSMSPTIVLRDGKPVLALGSPGGATIITTVLQVLIETLDFRIGLPAAIAAPRAANFNTASGIAEPAFLATPEARALEARGQRFDRSEEIGTTTGIAFDADGAPTAAAEPTRRGGGAAAVTTPR